MVGATFVLLTTVPALNVMFSLEPWLDTLDTISTLSRHSLDTVDTVDTGVNRHHLDTTSTPPTLVSTSVDIRDALMLSTGVKSVNQAGNVDSPRRCGSRVYWGLVL